MSQSEALIKKPFTVDSKVVSELAFLFTIYILVTGLLILHFRAWEPDIVRQVLGISVYPAAFFGGVALVWPYITNVIWILPIACLVLMGLPFLTVLLGAWSLVPLGIFGVTATLFAYRASHPKLLSKTLQLVLIGSILAVIYFLIYNGTQYAHIFADIAAYNNALGTVSTYILDSLFHSAIVQMLANFDTPSIGLDGLKKISYHIWTHRWIAANLKLAGGEAILLLGICQQIVFLPVFFFTASLTLSLLTSIELPALVVCGLSFLAIWLLSTVKYSTGNVDFFLISESYAFSLPIFMAMLPVGRFWLFQACQSHRWLAAHPLAIAAAVVAVLACGAIKISSGVILALFLILCVLIPKLWRKDSISWLNVGRFLVLAAAFALGGLALVSTFRYGMNGSLLSILSIMSFARTHPRYFIWLNQTFLVCIILFYFLNRKNGKTYQKSQALMLTMLFLGSQVPGNLLDLDGFATTTIYFFEPALLVTLFFTVSSVASYWQIHDKGNSFFDAIPVNYSGQFCSQKLLIWGVMFIVIASISSIEVTLERFAFTKSNISIFFSRTMTILDAFSTQDQLSQFELLLSPPNQAEKLKQDTDLGAIQSHIQALNLSPNQPKPTAIYVSPDFVNFWRSGACWVRPLVIPAMTGFPLLNGVRDRNNDCQGPGGYYGISDYGMADYDSESWNRPLSESDLCTKATRLGFAQVLSITDRSKYKLLTCPAKTASK